MFDIVILMSLFFGIEDGLVILEDRLHDGTLQLHILHLALDGHRSHDRGRENYGEVERCHLALPFLLAGWKSCKITRCRACVDNCEWRIL